MFLEEAVVRPGSRGVHGVPDQANGLAHGAASFFVVLGTGCVHHKYDLPPATTSFPKTHLAVGWGLAACRAGLRVRFFRAAALVSKLEQAQKQYTLDRFLGQLDRAQLLICDELGYVTLSRGGVELLFRVFADRYERGSILVTSNLPFSDWAQIFQGDQMTAALLDRLCHRCHIFEMNGESYCFRESMKTRKSRKSE